MFDVLVNGERRTFAKSKATIGRAPENDITLPDAAVARHHAELALRAGKFVLVDLSTATGTFVNGRKILGAATIQPSDRISIGDFTLQVALPGEASTTEAASSAEPRKPGERVVCGRCGALVAPGRTTCFVCKSPYREPPSLQPHPEGLLLGLVSASSFSCRSCHLRSPVSQLDLKSEIDCRRCGASQEFDGEQWVEALDFSHVMLEVSAGVIPDPFGARGSMMEAVAAGEIASLRSECTRGIASEQGGALSVWKGKEPNAYELSVSPGMPLCAKCHAPLTVSLEGGVTTTRCATCNEQASYALSETARPVAGGLVGVVGEDHRADHPMAKSASAAGSVAMSLECPKCNASLPLQRDVHLVTCSSCSTVSMIPPRFLRLADAGVAPFWLVYKGPSRFRSHAAKKVEAEAEAARPAAKAPAKETAFEVPPGVSEPQAVRTVEERRPDEEPRRSGLLVIVLIILALAALLAYWLLR